MKKYSEEELRQIAKKIEDALAEEREEFGCIRPASSKGIGMMKQLFRDLGIVEVEVVDAQEEAPED